MELSADDAATIRFRGTRYAYDRREVDRFRELVIATLTEYETALDAAERRIRELERAPSHTPLRFRGRVAGDDVGRLPGEGPPEAFRRWLAERVALDTHARLLDEAHEEARRIRGLAPQQAAEEIERLTTAARDEALQVTRRAAHLAGRTEEEARARADAILDATIPDPDVDVEVLARRITDLRAGIAAVQARLDAAAPPGGEVITLDLRDPADARAEAAVAAGGGGTKKRRRARPKTGSSTPSTAELEAKMVELRDRLDPD